jgi:trehalose-6-phosphate synthase
MVPADARRFTADVALLTHLEGTVGNANERVIVLANRAPVRHERCGGRVVSTRSASGLVTALEPLLEKYSGTWVAHAAGSADTDVVDTLGGTLWCVVCNLRIKSAKYNQQCSSSDSIKCMQSNL